MKIEKLVVTGEAKFLARHQFHFKAMSPYFANLECIRCGDLSEAKLLRILMKFFYKITYRVSPSKANRFYKNKRAFFIKSQQTEQKIRQLGYTPDLVFHLYGLFSPFWNKFDIPYTMYLDYTMALAERNWSPWAPFINHRERDSWMSFERQAYERAYHLFSMSNLVKSSLIEDYGIEPQKITVVGSSGNFQEPYEGEKSFGSKQILFNGSDFERKGGDLVLAAFKKVKKAIPEAKLVIIGKKLARHEDGIDNPGRISSVSDMRNLFLKTDLVVAPAYCEPFGLFLVEAMNYGVPCIISASDGMPEIVDDGVNGIVINQPTSDILAKHIINLLRNNFLLASMSQQARHKVKTKLNWNNVANTIFQVLSTGK